MDKVPRLGRIITEPQERDAVHIAVAPVIAGMEMYPGEHIGFVDDGAAFTVATNAKELIGIVDPFLKEKCVYKGEKFYIFLYPNTITSLRHDWTHPSFQKEDELATYQPTFEKLKGAPAEEKWVTEYAERLGCTYAELMEAADNFQQTGEYFCRGGDFEGQYISDEFWEKYETIKRETVSDRSSFLTCSC